MECPLCLSKSGDINTYGLPCEPRISNVHSPRGIVTPSEHRKKLRSFLLYSISVTETTVPSFSQPQFSQSPHMLGNLIRHYPPPSACHQQTVNFLALPPFPLPALCSGDTLDFFSYCLPNPFTIPHPCQPSWTHFPLPIKNGDNKSCLICLMGLW